MTVLGFISLIIGFISGTLTDFFDLLAKPANNMLVLLVALLAAEAIRKTNALGSHLSALGGKVDALSRRLDALSRRLDESALLSDEAATMKLEKERQLVERLVSEVGTSPAHSESIAKDPSLAEAILRYQAERPTAASMMRPSPTDRAPQ